MQKTEYYLNKLSIGKELRSWLYRALLVLSLVVVLGVFWELKLTGITLAGEACCGIDEHEHSDTCTQRTLICTLEETENHTHTLSCCEKTLQCPLSEQEAHIHSDACTSEETVLWCDREETVGHFHDEQCYTLTEGNYACGLEETEDHIHTWQCCEKTLYCPLDEQEGHTHGDECSRTETVYTCSEAEITPHSHDETCYIISEGNFLCGLEETEGHTHGDTCYEILEECPLEVHIHIPACYSDVAADLESSADWYRMMAELELPADPVDQLILIAQSQLGYQESIRNFQVDENGIQRGITRYGQWYGNPYGDWSAMFVGYCLHYSGLNALPVNAGPESMRQEWQTAGLYGPAAEFAPAVGNLLFLDKDGNGTADAVAIAVAIADGRIQAIEGNVNDAVAETVYAIEDPMLLGYGQIPLDQPVQPTEGTKVIAQTESDSESLFADGSCLVVYITDGIDYYAIDGNGDIVPVTIDEAGWVYTDLEMPEMLLWNVTATEDGGYVIENAVTQMYLPESYQPVATYSREQEATETAPNYQYARAVNYTVWLDGTDGGLMSYGDAQNTAYTVTGGSVFQLPETWRSSSEYNYVLKGWYDVVNNRYYEPGAQVTVNSNLVFYADWVASSYDIGQFNSKVANTVSTNEFITTRMFDYGILFNVLSSSANVQFSNGSHTENWNLITNGNSPYSGQSTLNFIFRDWDQNNDITYPNGVSEGSPHWPTNAGSVYSGLYNSRIASLLFDPNVSVIGKNYLGTADHLFQLITDPSDPYCGYYYYDSERNAASYNQSDQRFYVYDYLEQTTVSATTEGTGKYSDFLPFNSPYANTNGKTPTTYTYSGKDGEYAGVTHYMYDATNSSDSNVATNFLYGMQMDIHFYLPNAPGSNANQDVYGKDMHFKFSGDDDVWIFIDGKLVLDLGGIHGIEGGDINFSTGVVTVNGVRNEALTNTLKTLGAGDHTLTLYYLERGSSMSNCALYFNLAPRFSFSIQKEDVLTKDVLNGAQFSVYLDRACSKPAELWVSKESHDRGDAATHVFTVVDGVANMWGMGAGNVYYIKESKPPDAADYSHSNGIICVTIDKMGLASYSVEMMEEGSAGISAGFMVHGFRIDEQTQKAYIVATNAPEWVEETTKVTAFKKWNDTKDHSGDIVTVYLTITDDNGTVRRLQEAQLGPENNWRHEWDNLPKYAKDGVTLIRYGVEEAYVNGYYSKVTQTSSHTVTTSQWQQQTTLENGKTYILGNGNSYLSTLNYDSDTGFQWVSKETAQTSNLALWTVKTSGNKVMLTNGANQTLSFYYGNGSYITDFFAATDQNETNDVKRYFTWYSSVDGVRLYYDANTDYYLSPNLNSSKKFDYTTQSNSAMALTPWTFVQTTTTEQLEGVGFEIVNTPLTEETSLTVTKYWDYGNAVASNIHGQAQVTVMLLANGKGTGRTVTLSLKNGWKDTFRGLPYKDDSGNVINYTVVETWENEDWIPVYGSVVTVDGKVPSYTTHVTNKYRAGMGGPELPSTGSSARRNYMLCGSGILLFSLVYGIGTRRKRERRMK